MSEDQKNSRRLELSISKNTPHGRWGQGPGNVNPRFAAGLPFPDRELLEFVAFFVTREKFSSNFPGTFPEFSSRSPEQTPETATAFSSFLRGRGPFPPLSGFPKCQGQIYAQGILHLRNPNLGPNSAKRILDARISDPNSWVEFFGPIFPGFQNSPSKIQPRNRAEKFTLHLCRATWLTKCCSGQGEK